MRDQSEMKFTKRLIHAAASGFGEPVIQRCEEWKTKATKDRIVEVTHDEIGIMQMQICGNGGIWRAGQASQKKHDDPTQDEEHGCWSCDLALPERGHP